MNNKFKDLIFFGIVLDEYEQMDFANDFLTGVRSNYFNSNCQPQVDRIVQNIHNSEMTFFYNMSKGQPLIYKSYINGVIFQRSFVSSKGYIIHTYRNGKVFKKIYFDNNHLWQKTEYYDITVADIPKTVELSSAEQKGQLVIEKKVYEENEIITSFLYPKAEMPADADYSVLAYTNMEFVYFNSVPSKNLVSKTIFHDERVDNIAGFNFGQMDFNLNKNLNSNFDITQSPYLTEDNGNPFHRNTNEKFNSVDEPDKRSEKDIENNFDVEQEVEKLVNTDDTQETTEATDNSQALLDFVGDVNNGLVAESIVDESSDTLPSKDKEEPIISVETTETTDLPDDDTTLEQEENSTDGNIEEPADLIKNTEPDPNKTFTNGDEDYNYFGTTDSKGNRSGYGRTTSSDGKTTYEGQYRNDMRDGFGTFYYKNGDINYVGNWQENIRNGFGVGFRSSDKSSHIGKWNNNVPTDIGARFDREGNLQFFGNYVNGKKQGIGITLDENNNFIVSKFQDDEVVASKLLDDTFFE